MTTDAKKTPDDRVAKKCLSKSLEKERRKNLIKQLKMLTVQQALDAGIITVDDIA